MQKKKVLVIPFYDMQAATGVSALSMATAAEAPKAAPVEKFRKDYKHVDHVIKTVDLTFKIFDDNTQVAFSMLSCVAVHATRIMSLTFKDIDWLE